MHLNSQDPPKDKLLYVFDLYSKGKFTETILEINILLKEFNNSTVLYNILGLVYFNIKKNDLSINCYNKSIYINPKNFEAYNNIGILLQNTDNPVDAIKNYKIALEINPSYFQAYNNLGLSLSNIGSHNEAIDNYKSALSISPNFLDAQNNMAVAYQKIGELETAIQIFKKALRVNPNNVMIYNNLGNAKIEIGDYSGALICFRKALEIKPMYLKASLNLARFPYKFLDKDSLTILEKLLLKLDHAKVLSIEHQFLKANILMQLDETELAFIEYRKVNKRQINEHKSDASDQQSVYNSYLRKLKNWVPNVLVDNNDKLSKLIILGPSRSGKSSLELLLAKSNRVKPFFEYKDAFNSFLQNYNFSKEKRYSLITQTNPGFVYDIINLFEKTPKCYLVLVKRDIYELATEIFIKDYNNGNRYSYDPVKIIEYINFYYEVFDILEAKIPKNIVCINYKEITDQPNEVIKKIYSLTSINLSINELNIKKLKTYENKNLNELFENYMNSSEEFSTTLMSLKYFLRASPLV
jgi:Tfp pilus assembly protein PilF